VSVSVCVSVCESAVVVAAVAVLIDMDTDSRKWALVHIVCVAFEMSAVSD